MTRNTDIEYLADESNHIAEEFDELYGNKISNMSEMLTEEVKEEETSTETTAEGFFQACAV